MYGKTVPRCLDDSPCWRRKRTASTCRRWTAFSRGLQDSSRVKRRTAALICEGEAGWDTWVARARPVSGCEIFRRGRRTPTGARQLSRIIWPALAPVAATPPGAPRHPRSLRRRTQEPASGAPAYTVAPSPARPQLQGRPCWPSFLGRSRVAAARRRDTSVTRVHDRARDGRSADARGAARAREWTWTGTACTLLPPNTPPARLTETKPPAPSAAMTIRAAGGIALSRSHAGGVALVSSI